MAVYPVNQGGKGSRHRMIPDAGIQFTAMQSGLIRGFKDYTEEVYQITCEHFWLNDTDRDAIIAVYDAGPTTLHSIVTNEGTFDVYFVNRPQVTDKSGPLSMVVSTFIGTKQ